MSDQCGVAVLEGLLHDLIGRLVTAVSSTIHACNISREER